MWVYPKTNETRFEQIIDNLLTRRGIVSAEDKKQFLEKKEQPHSPMLMADIHLAVDRLRQAHAKKERVIIWGDFDADGASATIVAMKSLSYLGFNVNYFINNRFRHGYGINPLAVQDFHEKFPQVDLIVTVDNGIVAYDGIRAAQALGIDVIVTDHHDIHATGRLPEAIAVINPKRTDCSYPFKDICGAAVIWKVMLALAYEMEQDLTPIEDLIDIVGLATVGDVMPLHNENRYFVRESLKCVKNQHRLVWNKLLAAKEVQQINEELFGFTIVPLINAPSRLLGCIDKVVELFLTDDVGKMDVIIKELIGLNEERKKRTAEQEQIAIELVEKIGEAPAYVLYHPSFDEGIVGLIAGRIKEQFHRPTIVLTNHEKGLKGSGRSIEDFHINNALHAIHETLPLIGFGGHPAACGLSIHAQDLEAFTVAFIKFAAQHLSAEQLEPKIFIESYLPEVINPTDISLLEDLRPFGQGFSKPIFLIDNFKVSQIRYMGAAENHLRLVNHQKTTLIMFKHAAYYRELGEPLEISALVYPVLNVWNNQINVQLMVLDNQLRAK